MDRLKSMLVAVDFSPCSADAFRQAARIAAWNGAALKALHVVPFVPSWPAPHAAVPFELPTQGEHVEAARRRWDAFVPDCTARASTPFVLDVGNPRSRILDHVHRERPDLLVLGAHGAQDASKGVGPTAAACVQQAGTRVLLVREGGAGRFANIVACVDFTATSRLALEQAIRVAAQDGSTLHVLHLYEDPWLGYGAPDAVRKNMPGFAAAYREAIERRLREFCEPLVHELNALGAKFHAEPSEERGGLRASGQGHGVVAFARRVGCDLAVLGTRGTWNLRDFLWGSTAERVVRGSDCAILAVKPAGFRQPESAEAPEASARGAELETARPRR